MSMKDTMRIVKLEAKVKVAHQQYSMALNLIEQVKVALEEDDPEEALRLIEEAS